jgi:hypothetical protein
MKKPTPKPNMVEETTYSQIDKAKGVLNQALEEITKKADLHGDTEASFTMLAEMWSVYIKNVAIIRGWTEVNASDVAQMMVLLKVVRSAYGHNNKDNYTDAAGYTSLAYMLQVKGTKDD